MTDDKITVGHIEFGPEYKRYEQHAPGTTGCLRGTCIKENIPPSGLDILAIDLTVEESQRDSRY